MILSSNISGPAGGSGGNRSGAKGSTTTCGPSGCHGSATGPAVTISMFAGTTPVTKYTPGAAYTVKIHGAGSTNTKFGFQFASVSGTGTSQVQAGTASALPTNVTSHLLSALNFIEQSNTLNATSAGVYDVSFTWTAPATAVGNITLYCTLNAVNGDGNENSADVSGNTSLILPVATASVAALTGNISVSAFPNPAINSLNLKLDNAQTGNYAVEVFNLGGKVVATENIMVNGNSQVATINTGNWAAGTYMISVEKDGNRQVIPVVKQ